MVRTGVDRGFCRWLRFALSAAILWGSKTNYVPIYQYEKLKIRGWGFGPIGSANETVKGIHMFATPNKLVRK